MALAVAVLAVSCKEKPVTPEPGPDTPSGGTAELKVTLPSDGPLGVYVWSEYEEFRVGGSYYEIKSGAGTRTAVFDGTPAKDSYYMLAYPSDITGTDRYLSYNLEGQYQKANGSVEHLIPTVLIEDATTWEDITLSEAWAKAHGGSFRTNGVIAFDLKLPADAGELESLTLESAGVKFPVNNSGDKTADNLTLMLTGVKPGTASLKAFLSVSEKSVEIPATQGVKLTVTGDNTYSVMLPQAVKMGGGILTEIKVTDASAWTGSSAMKGAGTEASPYVIASPEHMEQMRELAVAGKTTWFELGADIDMSGVLNWVPVCLSTPYDIGVHFDGKGHKISHFKCEFADYPSMFGVLNGTVQNVTFEDADISGVGKCGVVAGYLGTEVNGSYVVANLKSVTVTGSKVAGESYAGGIAGQINCPGSFTDCHVKNTTVSSTTGRVGGLFGQAGMSGKAIAATIRGCSAEEVTVSAPLNVGGLIGVCYMDLSECTASGHVTASEANTKEVSVGGLIGHIEGCNVAKCSASTVVELTLQGRSIGGFVGTFKGGRIERCFATGAVTGTYRNNGGFVGLIQASVLECSIEKCYATGNLNVNGHSGGFAGLIDGQPGKVRISQCYCSGDVVGTGFGIGGFIGYQGSTVFTGERCAAWGTKAEAGVILPENWSSGAFSGITFPLSTLTDNYRNPAMSVVALWVPAAGYSHPDVSPTAPLVNQAGQPTAATSLANSQPDFPQFPYHGKVEAGKTLSQLASTTLGWDAAVWDFSKDLPTLK